MARVGYFDKSYWSKDNWMTAGIEAAGHEALRVDVPDAKTLAELDTLVVYLSKEGHISGEFREHLEAVKAAAANGLTVVFHDGDMHQVRLSVPGSENFEFDKKIPDTIIGVEFDDSEHPVHDGIGGDMGEQPVDLIGGWVRGAVLRDSLPDDAEVILTTDDDDEVVSFTYGYGEGRIIYSTIDVNYFLGRGSHEKNADDVLTYYTNLIEWASEPALNPIEGTNREDTITGTDGDDLIEGHGMRDVIKAGDGDDTVYGNTGHDHLEGGIGDDWLYGGKGGDWIEGGEDNDEICGNSGDDILHGGAGDDVIYGNADTDSIYGGTGSDEIYGGSGDDYIWFNHSLVGELDLVDGGSGTDTIGFLFIPGDVTADLSKNTIHVDGGGTVIAKSIENYVGTYKNDTITGSKGDNVLDGDPGDDWIRGKEGADTLTGGQDSDTFFWHRKDIVDSTGQHLGLDTITDFSRSFDRAKDTLDFTGLIKNTKFDDITDVVSLTETDKGTLVSVYSGAAHGMQDVVLLEGRFNMDVERMYDSGEILA